MFWVFQMFREMTFWIRLLGVPTFGIQMAGVPTFWISHSWSFRYSVSLRSKRFRASSSRTSRREQKKKEEWPCSNFLAIIRLETLAKQANILCASLKDKCLVYFLRLWKDVTKCLKEDDVESATGFKHKVFSQRQDSSFSQSQYAHKF